MYWRKKPSFADAWRWKLSFDKANSASLVVHSEAATPPYPAVIQRRRAALYGVIKDGNEIEFLMEAGQSYFRSFGVEHDVISMGDAEQSFVEVELKARAG